VIHEIQQLNRHRGPYERRGDDGQVVVDLAQQAVGRDGAGCFLRRENRMPTSDRGAPAGTLDVLQGTLDLLVLKALSVSPIHGWGISQRLQELSGNALTIGQGSLYPALYRLERKSLVRFVRRSSDNNRDAKYYELTAAGRRALAAEINQWRRFSSVVDLVLAAE